MAQCQEGRGKLYRAVGRLEAAREHLDIAVGMYREMGMGWALAQTERAIAELAG
ncbi:MAG: hypothetical protein L0027_08730 [Candidatus Rokubacteria bacterium]|nr:hypothetical protein [Candidatus Rokubacteria bacterium]